MEELYLASQGDVHKNLSRSALEGDVTDRAHVYFLFCKGKLIRLRYDIRVLNL